MSLRTKPSFFCVGGKLKHTIVSTNYMVPQHKIRRNLIKKKNFQEGGEERTKILVGVIKGYGIRLDQEENWGRRCNVFGEGQGKGGKRKGVIPQKGGREKMLK